MRHAQSRSCAQGKEGKKPGVACGVTCFDERSSSAVDEQDPDGQEEIGYRIGQDQIER
jgi:hypothetical protein